MIEDLIKNEKISIHLQAIITIKDKKIFAYESLCRAKDMNNDFISPISLFKKAQEENKTIILDNYLRVLALKKFKKIYENNNQALLFLNLEGIFIDEDFRDNLLELTKKYEIPSQNIVIEIKEDVIKDNKYLERFVKIYKSYGFILAIDDFGAGYSSFDRLSIIKPDIVKIDRSLIDNIQNSYINKQILNAISSMCHNIGALVLAEGVEAKNEVLACMKYDIDIFQGYWFSKPKNIHDKQDIVKIVEKSSLVGNEFKLAIQDNTKRKKRITKKIKKIVKRSFLKKDMNMEFLFICIDSLIRYKKTLEAIYVLDYENGLQIGDTFINTSTRAFYLPTKEGHDHSLKKYFYMAKEAKDGDYLGDRYISKATGNSCKTYTTKLNINDKEVIVCFDLIARYVLDDFE